MKTKIVSSVLSPPADLRFRILEGSRELFFKYGYSRLSMDELAEDLGISKATIYRYFPDKEALLRAVMAETREWILAELQKIVRNDRLLVKDRLTAYLEFFSRFVSGISRDFIRDLRQKLPDLWKELDEFRQQRVLPLVSEVIAEGVRNHEIKSDLDGRLFLEMFWHLVQEFMNPDWIISHDYSPSELLQSIIDIIFYGIFVEEKSRKVSGGETPGERRKK
ncbi:MAG: TetR/AcrR family transcriptional regulator [Candidatus Saccharicenans sp.]|uniref:TetR/AcrR family transcriptional regulator n=1 Tax=Candidatus Saccharicenans sp. TaxID=2819258 RepID=UPI0040490837